MTDYEHIDDGMRILSTRINNLSARVKYLEESSGKLWRRIESLERQVSDHELRQPTLGVADLTQIMAGE